MNGGNNGCTVGGRHGTFDALLTKVALVGLAWLARHYAA